MLTKSYKIMDIFLKNPTRSHLLKDIKRHKGIISESYTYSSLNYFIEEGVLTKKKLGGVGVYKIADNSKAISFLSIAAEYKAWKEKGLPFGLINDFLDKLDINFVTLLVVGSYAKGKQTPDSDLDMVLIVPSNPKRISSQLRYFCEMSVPQIHLYVFTDEEFKSMLLDKKYNYGKEAVKDNLIFFGAEAYYKLIFEAMKNGFTY